MESIIEFLSYDAINMMHMICGLIFMYRSWTDPERPDFGSRSARNAFTMLSIMLNL